MLEETTTVKNMRVIDAAREMREDTSVHKNTEYREGFCHSEQPK